MTEILFATGNAAKLAQARFIVEALRVPFHIASARERFGDVARYEEIGDTVEDVAQNGALDVSKRLRAAVFTEDTDLRIDALDGSPGIRAGTFLKEQGRKEILRRLEGKNDRRATIRSAVAYATPSGDVTVFARSLSGKIAHEEQYGAFPSWIAPSADMPLDGGYNAIFIPDGQTRTLAEIPPEESFSWSYRERTLADLFLFLRARGETALW